MMGMGSEPPDEELDWVTPWFVMESIMRISELFICAVSMFHFSNTGMQDVAFAGGKRTIGR